MGIQSTSKNALSTETVDRIFLDDALSRPPTGVPLLLRRWPINNHVSHADIRRRERGLAPAVLLELFGVRRKSLSEPASFPMSSRQAAGWCNDFK
jgi:hypothetical protein